MTDKHLHDSSPELKVYTHLRDHSVSCTRHCVCGHGTWGHWHIAHILFVSFSGAHDEDFKCVLLFSGFYSQFAFRI